MFQFLSLYAIPYVENPPFWIGLSLTFVINVADATGILSDLYETMVSKLRVSNQAHIQRRNEPEFSHNFVLQDLRRSIDQDLNQSLTSNDWFSRSLQGSDTSNIVSTLVKALVQAMDIIHQQCYTILISSALLVGIWLFDLWFDAMIPNDSACAIRCSYLSRFRGWKFVVTKHSIIYLQYIGIAGIASVFWRKRVKVAMEKYVKHHDVLAKASYV